MHFMTPYIQPSIPYTIPLNTPNTIQTLSSLVDSSLVYYVVLLISNGFKSCLFFIGWIYITLVIIGIILHMCGYVLNTYGSDLKSIHHSYFYIHQFSPVAYHFPTMALYLHGDTKTLVIYIPYDNIYDISQSFQSHFRIGKVLQQFEKKMHGPHHHLASIQETDCIDFCTLWEGVWTYLFSFLNCVCISEYEKNNKHSDNAPNSSYHELQGVSPLLSCRYYTLAHDHGVHNFFIKLFYQKQFIQLIQVKKKICCIRGILGYKMGLLRKIIK